MKIKVYQLTKEKDTFNFSYTENLSEFVNGWSQVISISPTKVEGSVTKVSGVYTVKGKVKTDLILQCSRCLKHFDFALEADFEEIFLPEGIQVNWGAQEDQNVHLLESDEIDLTPIVEEAVILNLPYVPVCHEDCKGLCPNCGTNLNEETCDCKTERIDPRLADLKKWFDKGNTTE